MSRDSRFELVRTDAKQPWFVREIAANGKQTWKTSENYAGKSGAVMSLIQHIRRIHPGIKVWWSDGTGGPELRVGMPGDVYESARKTEVRELDWRKP